MTVLSQTPTYTTDVKKVFTFLLLLLFAFLMIYFIFQTNKQVA